MSTNAIVAYAPEPETRDWTGVYHHYDGYPTGLGRTLHRLCRERFAADADALGRYTTREHSSWSFIADPDGEHGVCYCHGEHADTTSSPARYRPADLADDGVLTFIEWAYVIEPERLIVLAPVERAFKPVGHVAWAEDPTDQQWTHIECGEHFERCTHYAWAHFDVPDEAKRLPTAKWLGHEPLDPVQDAIGWRLPNGTLARRGGYAYAGSYRGRPRGWYESVALPDGTSRELRVCQGERHRRLRGDLAPVYPPTASGATA